MRRLAIRLRVPQNTDLGLMFVVVIWGISPVFFKFLLREIQPLAFVYLRFVLLSLLSLAVLAWRGVRGGSAWRIRRQDVALLIVSGLSGYGLYQLFYMIGLAHTSVFSSALLVATVPLWSVVLLAVFRIERVHPVQWAGILLSLVGVAWFLLAGGSHSSKGAGEAPLSAADVLLGNALSLGAAVLFAVYGIVNKRLAPQYSPAELMCYTLCIGTLVLTPFGLPALLSQNWAAATWRTWVIVPYSIFFPIYITYSIWNWAIGVRGVGHVTLYSYAVPVMGGIASWILLRESLTVAQVLADEKRESYRTAGAKKANAKELVGPRMIARGALATVRTRQLQTRTVGDAAQLGGALVVIPDGTVIWSHMSEDASDNAQPDEILAALRAAR